MIIITFSMTDYTNHFMNLGSAKYTPSHSGRRIFSQCVRCLSGEMQWWQYADDIKVKWFCRDCFDIWETDWADPKKRVHMNKAIARVHHRLIHPIEEYHEELGDCDPQLPCAGPFCCKPVKCLPLPPHESLELRTKWVPAMAQEKPHPLVIVIDEDEDEETQLPDDVVLTIDE